MRLKGKNVVVTGSGRGIGRAIALACAKEGAQVVVNCVHKANALKVVAEIKKMGGNAIAACGDVSKSRDAASIVKAALKQFRKIDILVNNAGIVHFNPLLKITEKEWDQTLAVNLRGTFLMSQAVAKHMVQNNVKGNIVNIASIAGKVGFQQLAHYCASKGGIIELTKEMALELAPHGIRVNAIGPGVIETDMTKGILDNPESAKQFLKAIPMGRVGQPEEIAKVAVFLASEDASYMTGHTIFADGGWVSQ
ncbi:MAG TPA: 3-oxoacyl-ACP reductase family protein [Candidatus Nanoarchaeia archaeon]|nr:3-oxoacyl-ACP reductase family protein [Candidatus Nanoarchaeia archaeon]